MTLVPAPRATAIAAYRVPPYAVAVDLKLDANEGPPPPPDLLATACADATETAWRYPNRAALRATLAAELGVAVDQLIVTAGGDDALDRALRCMLAPGTHVVLPSPSFAMLARYATWAGGGLVHVPWPDGPYPTDAVLAAITAETRAIAVVSPNNPTGTVATADDLRRLSDAAPHALLIVDLAYVEFADEDLTAVALSLPNAVVFRTLSKAWGLAGLRVGYAAGPAEVIGWMRAVGNPYTVAGPSAAAALHQLRHGRDAMTAYVAAVRDERTVLADRLRAAGWRVPDSEANFVFARSPRAPMLRAALAAAGIGIRGWPGHPELGDAVRITLPGNTGDFARLLRAVDAVLDPDVLLFDMDGVLVDVSASYLAAIVATAATLGVTVTGDDVHAAKAAGDANNDWVLTHRLITAAGVDVSLAEVTAVFERHYQGTADQPGLKETERCLVSRETWDRWRARRPIGIVTGRPRSDALAFLEAHDLPYDALVCMEDAPAKPDPAPVRLALARLGRPDATAWMFGDTRDDLVAGRGCGAVPIGVLAPGDDDRAPLVGAGAATILTRVTQLDEVLP
jgi:histidinol-phosphate aminotransferase